MTEAWSFDPRTGRSVPAPAESAPDEVDTAVAAAAAAAPAVAAASPQERAGWLEAIADALDANRTELAALADEEVALGMPRLTGEAQRAAAAFRFYAGVAREGSWLEAVIETGPGRPELRKVQVPLGPVAVFGASNFPFGFGVLGHDTATALAAGCPVVVKAHPAHPRLSAALFALAAPAAPPGALSLIAGYDAGRRLVDHPAISAVAFTGSQQGGLALWRQAAARERVIPVYAEMGTVNAVVVTARGAARRADEIAAGFVASFTQGMGQFCTKPGLLLVPAGSDLESRVARALTDAAPQGWMLTERIAASYASGVASLRAAGARVLATTAPADGGWAAAPTVLGVDAIGPFLEECFGPVALVASYTDLAEVLPQLPGSLAAAVHGGGPDDPEVPGLVAALSGIAGRVIVDGWPTGVVVGWGQQHGGPWPATTAPQHTSVGAGALRRFLRPVTYQDVPAAALPPALRDDNPWGVPRREVRG
ncbi:aldehyde dehydrogenase [Actinoplanes ianthinogenes]|uniref:Aldehyde dehydrogenase n=1 Tax=Actinoplanes ianthinogenes TaxID=122358 RepID=A0ABM7M9N4_9ACTN|nr:aldehyde dehydrogenase family protein [Actinoplanes ianthinogenes]BCJ48380.1 aldehyde dehydrogenase [Actinoplanes ianthinogenes]GGR46777.1 aldehyde dehydrogenase [Actinoplanes ianthinogenes]